MTLPRKNIRLPQENYLGERAYFLTICCDRRQPFLEDPQTVSRLLEILTEEATRKQFVVHAYCFMPDHAHLLVEGTSPESKLPSFLNIFKQKSAFEYRRKTGLFLWQLKCYDHILRRRETMEKVAAYIWMNPVRKGLVREPWDFPFSGSLTMPWKHNSLPIDAWVPPWKTGGEEIEEREEEGMPG